ncbi:MAG TPA: hypothetical protein VGE27_01330 [Gemmatimonas sp.]|uniref:hypothetical protein n=1 Tax=Gemmatimonas sp. TaxID=1962908 RepID=UPI002ED87C44
MPSQPSLRPFDIAVALRLVLVPEDRYEPLANALATSTSAVHRAVARLQQAGLCGMGTRTVNKEALREFLVHGVRYTFPPVHGPERTGLPTAGAHPALAESLGEQAGPRLVWPSEGGTARGESLTPLFTGMTRVAQRDSRMHELLATVDLLRVGSDEQREAAGALLVRQIMGDPSVN